MRTRLIGLAIALCLLTGCNLPVVGPEPPKVPDIAGVGFTIQPPLMGIKFVMGLTECVSDERGVAWCPDIKAADYFLKLDLPEDYEQDAGGIYSINKSSCRNVDGEPSWPNCEIKILVTKKKPVIEPAVGRVTTNGEMFSLNGSPWQWRGATDFMLFRDYLDGKNIDDVLLERHTAGANLVRVLGMAHYIPVNAGQPAFNAAAYPQYFESLRKFVDYVATFGLRVEFTALADAQILLPGAANQDAFLARVVAALPETAFLEIANEPFKNGADVAARYANLPRTALVVATGDYTFEKPVVGEYVTVHETRDAEWPRKSRLDEWYANVHMPVVWDEPIGADEADQPGRRSNVVEDFYDLCAGSALHGAGLTFHSTSGLLSQMWRDHEGRSAVACFEAMRAVPVEAPLWDYTRGGLGNNPLAHDDAIALRTWCQMTGTKAVCEVVRPSVSWTAVAVNGWRIVKQEGPNGRLVFLER